MCDYFILCLYCIFCGDYVFFRVTFCYDNLGVWDYFGWWYKSCVSILYGGEVCIYDVFVVVMLVFCIIFC